MDLPGTGLDAPRDVRREPKEMRMTDLPQLADELRALPGVRAKADIGLVAEVLGSGDWFAGPGDDGAVLPDGAGRVVVGQARGVVDPDHHHPRIGRSGQRPVQGVPQPRIAGEQQRQPRAEQR